MMKEKIIAVFDIGKTNKKLVLFNYNMQIISEYEEKFAEIKDDDGFECDDIDKIEKWIIASVNRLAVSAKYDLQAVNFTTYGATFVYLDRDGNRIGPVYNYLKPVDEMIPEKIYRRYGGQDEFCRQTASPALGMLNAGMQVLWLKETKPEIYAKVATILHFPQYLSYLLTGKIYSEHTSIGCHTAIWDFDSMEYHKWTKDEGFHFPDPVDVHTYNEIKIGNRMVKVGIGIHDSSSSLVPYFTGSNGKFILLSTGTWCINMNPFNTERLTARQLDLDCLCYMSIAGQPVKSSRLFMGNFHEKVLYALAAHFNVSFDFFKSIRFDEKQIVRCSEKFRDNKIFFENFPYSRELKPNPNLFVFDSYSEAYHQLMIELTGLAVEAVHLIIPANDDTENIYITGGFSKNAIFKRIIAEACKTKKVYTSEIPNATALGAALIMFKVLFPDSSPALNLGLSRCLQ